MLLKPWYPTQRKERMSLLKKKITMTSLVLCFRVCAVLLVHMSRLRLRRRRSRAGNSIVQTSITVFEVQIVAISLAVNHQAVL